MNQSFFKILENENSSSMLKLLFFNLKIAKLNQIDQILCFLLLLYKYLFVNCLFVNVFICQLFFKFLNFFNL